MDRDIKKYTDDDIDVACASAILATAVITAIIVYLCLCHPTSSNAQNVKGDTSSITQPQSEDTCTCSK